MKFEFKHNGQWVLAKRIKHLSAAFIIIPAIISCIVVLYAKIGEHNLFSIIPDNLFKSIDSLTPVGVAQMATIYVV